MNYSPLGSSVHGISQARILGALPFPPPGDLPDPGIEPASPELAGRRILFHLATRERFPGKKHSANTGEVRDESLFPELERST